MDSHSLEVRVDELFCVFVVVTLSISVTMTRTRCVSTYETVAIAVPLEDVRVSASMTVALSRFVTVSVEPFVTHFATEVVNVCVVVHFAFVFVYSSVQVVSFAVTDEDGCCTVAAVVKVARYRYPASI